MWRQQPSTAHESAPVPYKIGRKGGKGEILWAPYIPYGLFQTTVEMCAKFSSDRFRNVDLYKAQTNKHSSLYVRWKTVGGVTETTAAHLTTDLLYS